MNEKEFIQKSKELNFLRGCIFDVAEENSDITGVARDILEQTEQESGEYLMQKIVLGLLSRVKKDKIPHSVLVATSRNIVFYLRKWRGETSNLRQKSKKKNSS